jgi:capsular exopolysaccharide synthesis family protein
MTGNSAEFDLQQVLRIVWRRLPILLVCVVVVTAAAVGVTAVQKKQYTATAALLFRDPGFAQKLFGSQFVPSDTDPARQAATNVGLVSLPQVASLAAAHLHETQQQVSSAVSTSSSGSSDIVSIQATERNPALAATVANTYANTFIAFRRDADLATVQAAAVPLRQRLASMTPPERNGAVGQSLQERLGQLNLLGPLQTGGAELVQPAAVPGGPSSPKPVRNGAFGAFFGLLLGIAMVLVAEARDRRLRDPGEMEHIFDRPLLLALHKHAALESSDPGLLTAPEIDREAFRTLWMCLRYFRLSRDIRSVLVTSPDRDDGKTTVAWGLAVMAASTGTKTLLIEADLRNPTLASRYDAPVRHGLGEVVLGEVAPRHAIVGLSLTGSHDGLTAARTLDVLFAGHRPPDPIDLLQSASMASLLRQVEEDYELVVIDTPPAVVSDAIPLIAMVGGVIVVGRLGNTLRDHARKLHQQLHNLDSPTLGVVVNSVDDRYAYGYGYGYGIPAPQGHENGTGHLPDVAARSLSEPGA